MPTKDDLVKQLATVQAELKKAKAALAAREKDAQEPEQQEPAQVPQEPEAKEPVDEHDLQFLLRNLRLQSSGEEDHNLRIRDISILRNEKFNDENWMTWSTETKAILEIHGLWNGVVVSPDTTLKNFKKRNLQARAR